MNRSWFFMSGLIINLSVVSHLSLTFTTVYFYWDNSKNSCTHTHTQARTRLSSPTKVAVYAFSTSPSSSLWKANKNQMSVDYVGEMAHNKKNREAGQFSSEKTETAIPH